jgi:ABC-type glycerol-3-phosphate transport system permease component
MQATITPVVRKGFPYRIVVQYGVLTGLVLLALVPVFMMIDMSLRPTPRIYADFWAWPSPATLSNYRVTLVDLTPALLRTLYVCAVSIGGILAVAAPAAYGFARLKFPGRDLGFQAVLLVMLVPGVVLLTPYFILANQLHLRGSLEGLILFYIAGGQPFAVFLLTTYFKSQSEEIFGAARLDGANELQAFIGIAIPLAAPILATIAIMNFLSIYSDYIWPLLMLPSPLHTLMPALERYNPQLAEQLSRPDLGPQAAGYAFATIPQLVIIAVGMRYFVQGLTSGAMKA